MRKKFMQVRLTKFIGLIFLSILSVSLSAQENLIFEEDFDDNFLRWLTGDKQAFLGKIDEGHYHLEYKGEKGFWYSWQSVPIHADTSFYIESSIAPTLHTKRSAYGIIWNVRNSNSYYAFLVSNMGMTSLISYKNGQFNRIIDWTPTGNYQNNQQHLLGIRQKNGKQYFYLDNKEAFAIPAIPIKGDLLGFFVTGKAVAKIDYLKVYQDRAINLVEDAVQGYKKENLGPLVNSEYAELHPIIAHDGQSLYFTRNGHPKNMGFEKKDDAWVAYKQEDGSWSPAVPVGEPINNYNHNQVIAVSPDNNTLLVGNTYLANGLPKGKGISITHRQEDGRWEVPNEIHIDNYYNQNPIHSIHLAPNKQTLLLSIERNDSYGHLDLYVSFKQKNGRFSQPKNLGPTVNTIHEDGTPFLAADGKTLYFSSAGHGGYGSTDIFVTKRLDDSWKAWTTPKNLGPEINSRYWDGHYSTTASGQTAYMVSSKGKNHIGYDDIYKIIPPVSSRPEPVLLVKGKILDGQTDLPIRTKVFYTDATTEESLGDALSDKQAGKYQIILPANRKYRFLSFKNGYFPTSETWGMGKIDEYTEVYRNIYLFPIEEGVEIPLPNIESEQLTASAKEELDRLVTFMEKYPNMRINLQTTTESLFEKMEDYLTKEGIALERLQQAPSSDDQNSFTITNLSTADKEVERVGNFDPRIKPSSLQKGQIFRLDNMHFPADSANITTPSANELMRLYQFLEKNPTITIEISGHTNGFPEHDYCDSLSEKRARNAAQFLIQQGIAAKRLLHKGYGKRQPIATNATLRGRQKNQRVEIKIITTSVSTKDRVDTVAR